MDDSTTDRAYDVVVVGGGAAGLGAALTLGRARRSVLVVDAGAPRNAPAGHVHNYLGREGTSPAELLAIGRAEVAGYGGEVVTGRVVTARPLGGPDGTAGVGFGVGLADGRTFRARRLVMTTGLVDELPDVPGVAQRWGRDVLHCPYCHGWEVRDQALGVLASGPFAVQQALLFRQWSADLTLFLHTTPPPGEEEAEQLAARGITVVPGEVAALEVSEDRLTGVRLRSGQVVPRQAVVVGPRFTANAGVLAGLGLTPTEMQVGGGVHGQLRRRGRHRGDRGAGSVGGRQRRGPARPGDRRGDGRAERRRSRQRRPDRRGNPAGSGDRPRPAGAVPGVLTPGPHRRSGDDSLAGRPGQSRPACGQARWARQVSSSRSQISDTVG